MISNWNAVEVTQRHVQAAVSNEHDTNKKFEITCENKIAKIYCRVS